MTLQAILPLGGVGLVFAVFIALANRRLWVWEDPRIDMVAAMLPNVNCGACGLPGCRAFAEQAVEGVIEPSKCSVGTDDVHKAIANLLGVEAANGGAAGCPAALRRRLRRRGDAGGLSRPRDLRGGGGRRGWRQGLRLGLPRARRLRAAVHFDAINMNDVGLPVVDPGQVYRLRRLCRSVPEGPVHPDAGRPAAPRAVPESARGR